MLNPKASTSYIFVIDTNGFAGNFHRALFSYVTGKVDTPDEDPPHPGELKAGMRALKLDPDREFQPNPFFDNLLETQVVETGDDLKRRYCTVLTTPGMYLVGGEIVSAQSLPSGSPEPQHTAYASVGFFLKRPPTPEEVAYMKERVEKWQEKTPDILVVGYRLVWSQTAWNESSID